MKFKPLLKSIVWGGDKILKYKNLDLEEKHIGESWEVSGVEGSLSVIANGSLSGKTLKEAIEEHKDRLVGRKPYTRFGSKFPLLVKFIDAHNDLSIQVHPDDEMAKRIYGKEAFGKTEMWYILDADKGASLNVGFNQTISKEEFEDKIAKKNITEVVKNHIVSKDEVYYVPAGRIHSICSGCFILEIQQSSDYTYRICDYDRPGIDGKPRDLHVELAKEALDFEVRNDYKIDWEHLRNNENLVLECDFFKIYQYELDKTYTKDTYNLDSFIVAVCIEGEGEISMSEGDAAEEVCGCESNGSAMAEAMACGIPDSKTIKIKQGETVLIPASSKSVSFIPKGRMKLVTSHI